MKWSFVAMLYRRTGWHCGICCVACVGAWLGLWLVGSGTASWAAEPAGHAVKALPSLAITPPGAPPSPASISPMAREIAPILEAAAEQIDVTLLPDPEKARADLLEALTKTEQLIAIGTPNGDAWAKFLRLDDLHELINSDRPSFSSLLEIEANMRQNYPGLERAAIVELRRAIRQWANALKYGRNPQQTQRILRARIEEAKELLDNGAPFETEIHPALVRVMTYLTESGQATGAVRQLRSNFSAPNVRAIVSETFANRIIGRPVEQPSPVDECILGTHVVGDAFLRGNLTLDFVPSDENVLADLTLVGTMTSINQGYNRGVVLKTTGVSPVEVSSRVRISPTAATTERTSIATRLATQIHAICHKLRLVRKIAKKKAAEQKPLADAIAEGRMQRRIRTRFLGEIQQQLGDLNAQLQGGPRPELVRLGFGRPEMAVFSTESAAGTTVVAARADQLAAPADPPIDRAPDDGVRLQIHQSALDNTLSELLAGRTIRNTQLDDIALQFGDEVPPEIQQEVDGDPWEITFSDLHPVRVAFADGQIHISLQITRMIGKERTISNAIVAATYVAERNDDQWRLVRQGDLVTDLPTVRSPTQATTLRGILRAKFNEILAEEIPIESIDLTEVMPNLPILNLADLQADQGWLDLVIQ
ncbi:MAG: hypothetical protein D6753_14390 [Planctomycetota bacterium]|nr:MAG: hypothetical protein D6753_14390 [Planctomycetota bacterium]